MIEHTPGPWNVYHFVSRGDTKAIECGLYEIDEANEEVSTLLKDQHPVEAESIAMANRNLISAAPDLLDALEIVLEKWVLDADPAECYDLVDDARAAIARAKGE